MSKSWVRVYELQAAIQSIEHCCIFVQGKHRADRAIEHAVAGVEFGYLQVLGS